MNIYDSTGKELNSFENFIDNIDLDYKYDETTNATYTVIRIYKTKIDGSKQYPFVFTPNGSNAGAYSTYDMTHRYGFPLAINSGIFNTTTIKPDGIVIENGQVVQNSVSVTSSQCKPLTIDSNGDLSSASYDADATTLVNNGVVSAVCGFMPIIVDYEAVPSSEWNNVAHYTQNAQRQIIGQFGNGDYAIVTCEGRGYDHSDGWTIAEAQSICKELALKFAYNLDGGGSTETMLGLKHFNTIYENVTGRVVPSFIVFNGSDEFFIPNSN
jgi:exopolysaccharide biosynthesis protein